MLTFQGMTEPSLVPLDVLLHRIADDLKQLSAAIDALALGLEPRSAVQLRPWWDAPVRGLPLEEALKQYGESRPE